jgi:hypothetical protein
MSDGQGSCVQDAYADQDSFGIRRLALIRVHTATPGSSGSSVTLVRTVTSWVVVDSGGVADRERIIKGFADKMIRFEKVNVLLSTSLDPSSSSNDDLFPHALHHVKGGDWAKVKGPNPRRVVINTPYHWIDKYMKIVKVKDPIEDHLVLLVHFPRTEDLLEPSSRDRTGKTVGILGRSFYSASDPLNASLVRSARKSISDGAPRPRDPSTIQDILLYCDTVIPGQGEPIDLR